MPTTKFTAALGDRIVEVLRTGCYVETVCAAVGLSKDAVYGWLKDGARVSAKLANGTSPKAFTQRQKDLATFADAFQKALLEQEQRALVAIQVHGKKEWTALAWYLERRFPDRWGRRRLEVSGNDGAPIQTESSVTIYLPDNKRA